MGYVPVAQGRAQVQSVPGGIELLIPARRHISLILFLSVWLVGWCFGEFFAVHQLLWPVPLKGDSGPPTAFLMFWLCGWTIGGGAVLFSVLWMLAGYERATFSAEALTLRREVFGIGRSKAYLLSAVRDLRVLDVAPMAAFTFGRQDAFGRSRGPFAFDYGAKTIRFGAGIDPAEAKRLAAKVLASKPGLAPQDRY